MVFVRWFSHAVCLSGGFLLMKYEWTWQLHSEHSSSIWDVWVGGCVGGCVCIFAWCVRPGGCVWWIPDQLAYLVYQLYPGSHFMPYLAWCACVCVCVCVRVCDPPFHPVDTDWLASIWLSVSSFLCLSFLPLLHSGHSQYVITLLEHSFTQSLTTPPLTFPLSLSVVLLYLQTKGSG